MSFWKNLASHYHSGYSARLFNEEKGITRLDSKRQR